MKRETKNIKLNFFLVGSKSDLSNSFSTSETSTTREDIQQRAVLKETVGSIWPLACDSLKGQGTGHLQDTEQNCCHLQVLPHGGTKEMERPPSSASV